MAQKKTGTLIIIGGHEDKTGDMTILKEVVRHANQAGGKLVITTVATEEPEETVREYTKLFKKLGIKHIDVIDIRIRQDGFIEKYAEMLQAASALFFTGGDQLRITSQLGDSPLFTLMTEVYNRGGVVVGTSAGASVMSETMLVSGPSDESHHLGSLLMAPGLGLIKNVVIDQHFAERGRIGRLLGAVAQNPRNLGVGIDENTAIIVHDGRFEVIGDGAVYVVDGSHITCSNLSDGASDETLSCYDVRLHLLKSGDSFGLATRRPADSDQGEVAIIDVSNDGHHNSDRDGS
jgi:cyanophycinase